MRSDDELRLVDRAIRPQGYQRTEADLSAKPLSLAVSSLRPPTIILDLVTSICLPADASGSIPAS